MQSNQLKSSVIISYISYALSLIITFLYTPIMLRVLGQGEYGVYTLVNSVVANLSILSLGFTSSYIRFYSRYKIKNDHDSLAKLNGLFLTVFSVIALVALACGAVLTQNVDTIFENGLTPEEVKTAEILMRLLVINIAISFPASVFTSYITANERYVFLRLINMVKTVCSPLLNLALLFLGYGSVGMVVVTLSVNLIADGINVYFCTRKLGMRFSFGKFDFSLLKEIWAFSVFIFINIIIDQINWNVDKFILGMTKNSAAVAIYGLAAQLNNHYITISHTVSSVFIPRVNKLVAEKSGDEVLTQLFIKLGRIQFMILTFVLCIYIFYGDPFIRWWAGPEYGDSYWAGLVLISAVTIDCIQTIGIEIQRAKNMHKFRSLMLLVMSVCNIILTIPLCKRFGPIGAASATAFSLVLGNGVIMNVYYHNRIGLDIKRFWRQILRIVPGLIVPVVYGSFMNMFYPVNSVAGFVVQVAGMTILYCMSMWLLGLNTAEKEMIAKPIMRLRNKLMHKS